MDNNYKNFLDLVTERYSCRDYDSAPLSNEIILQVLETARLAPSACNKQPWKFLIVTQKEQQDKIIECYSRDWVKTAPAFIVCLGNNPNAWHRANDNKDHTDVDISIATEHICLAATSLGLGTCWICNFDVDLFCKLFSIPAEWTPIAIIPIGYPSSNNKIPSKIRKSLDEIVAWEKF